MPNKVDLSADHNRLQIGAENLRRAPEECLLIVCNEQHKLQLTMNKQIMNLKLFIQNDECLT